MLCTISDEENHWVDVVNSVPDATHAMSRNLLISTITSVFKRCPSVVDTSSPEDAIAINKQSVRLSDFMAFLTSKENDPVITKCMVLHLGSRMPIHIKSPGGKNNGKDGKDGKDEKELLGDFYNQLTMSVKDDSSTKSIKIFNNLTIHVTGCKSPYEARVVATFAWDMLSHVYPFIRKERYTQDIQMINATAEVNYSFNLKNYASRLRESPNSVAQVKYDPMESDYPGAIAKIEIPSSRDDLQVQTSGKRSVGPKTVTVMIFASGNLAFSGRSMKDIVYAYTIIVDFVASNKHLVQSKLPILSKKRQEETVKKRKYTLKGPRKNAKKINAIIV